MNRLKQAGDTIAEVLIAITVASTILTGAFVSAQHSLQTTRKSQERSEALKVAEMQLEHLKELAAKPGNEFTDPAKSSTSCITTAFAWQSTTGVFPEASEDFSNTGYHPTACTFRPAGGTPYYPSIRRTNPSGQYTYEVIIHWEAADGKGNQELILYYRLFS